MSSSIPLSSFSKEDQFYGKCTLLMTIKSFDLQAIRRRYLASRKNRSGKAGSVAKRPSSFGGLVSMTIENGKIIDQEIICKMKEPRGIDFRDGRIAVGSEKEVFVIDSEGTHRLTHPWFSYIHTVVFSPWHPERLLIASSGLDCVFEMDYKKKVVIHEWFAWENGFDQAHDPTANKPFWLTKDPAMAKKYEQENRPYRLIVDPTEQVLPTAMRAAFINSVWYDYQEGFFLATFFHEGAVYKLSLEGGEASKLLDGMKNPHGGRIWNKEYMATSTGTGEVLVGSRTYETHSLPGKPPELKDMEWIQNTIALNQNTLLAIDSNRNQLLLFSPKDEYLSCIGYDQNWAVQDAVLCKPTSFQLDQLKDLEQTTFNGSLS